ncbi:MAG: hypothetical protein B7Y99_09325 [Caulobacterales bacterium 32-69-10]|nr:MAG: hypothetical protein B7Y99_09325 [Caulobacterales bacterium 32-69-10]
MKSLAILLLVLLLWSVGLFAFGDRVSRSTPAQDPPQADGVVALTGASSMRIDAAVRLLELGKAKRLLISGVNREVRPAELRDVSRGAGRAYDCCVDLGFAARDTLGNARETAAWARDHGFKSLIVVTSDYHIPRSMLELGASMPGVTLHPYPVATNTLNARGWWRRGGDAKRLVYEYSKYLVILMREAVRGLGGQDAADNLQAPADAPGGAPA